MPIKSLIFAILFVISCSAYAQNTNQELLAFNQNRLQTNKIGMLTLGGWALINIGSGFVLSRQATGSNTYFHQMNAYWNVVNLALAGFGFYGATTSDPASFSLFTSIKEHYSMEKLLLFNTGLDIAYMATGLYLTEKAKTTKQADRLTGFGQSIILQGGFLFLFDTTLFFIHNGHTKLLKNIMNHVSFSSNSATIVLHF